MLNVIPKTTQRPQISKKKLTAAIQSRLDAAKQFTQAYSSFPQEAREIARRKQVMTITGFDDGRIYHDPPDPGQRQADRDPIVQAWGEYLDKRDWQLWTTLTTHRELTLPGARRSINKLSQFLQQNNYPAEIFWAAEPFDLKEGYHLHSLVRFTDLERRQDNKAQYNALVKGWRQITGDKTARIYSERYREDKGAHLYVGKYISKKLCDYDMIMPGINQDDQLEDPRPYQERIMSEIKEKEIEARKILQRKVIVSELQKKGILAGKPDPEPARYTDTRITFEQWEQQDYLQELSEARLRYPNRHHSPQFTISRR